MAPITQTRQGRAPAGSTVVTYGDNWTAAGSEVATVAETSLFLAPGATAAGPIDVSAFQEGVLLVNVTAIGGTSPSFTVKVYACDTTGNRYSPALVTRTVTATGGTRDSIPVPASNPGSTGPMGNYIEVTKTLTGTSPTLTATVELQLKT